jgi:alkane 1-monooxygenase
LVLAATWWLFPLLDQVFGRDPTNPDEDARLRSLFWYRAITLIWAPLQFGLVFGLIAYLATNPAHLTLAEKFGLAASLGVVTGMIGINYSHELMHRPTRLERGLADILLAMTLYSHFKTEHLLVHHIHVATPRDPASARYNEGFHRFFPRVLIQSFKSAWRAEAQRLEKRRLALWHRSNPFWRYGGLQAGMMGLAYAIGGKWGLAFCAVQAFVAVFHLEITNYIEHYGLTRAYKGAGKYEHVKPRHSWNADHRATNWLLINLQRHSDHHYRPDRAYPLLQTYDHNAAPQLPYGYPVMGILALCPPVWRRVMNPKVRAWRKQHYPQVKDWTPYSKGLLQTE